MIARLAAHAPRFARFASAGLLSIGVTLSVLTLLQAAGLSASAAYAAALAVAFAVNFSVNRVLVFEGEGRVGAQAAEYLLASLVFRGGEWTVFTVAHHFSALPGAVLAIGVQGGSMLLKYFAYAHVFRRRG